MLRQMIDEIESVYVKCDELNAKTSKLKGKIENMDKIIKKDKKKIDVMMDKLIKKDIPRDKKIEKCDEEMKMNMKKKKK